MSAQQNLVNVIVAATPVALVTAVNVYIQGIAPPRRVVCIKYQVVSPNIQAQVFTAEA